MWDRIFRAFGAISAAWFLSTLGSVSAGQEPQRDQGEQQEQEGTRPPTAEGIKSCLRTGCDPGEFSKARNPQEAEALFDAVNSITCDKCGVTQATVQVARLAAIAEAVTGQPAFVVHPEGKFDPDALLRPWNGARNGAIDLQADNRRAGVLVTRPATPRAIAPDDQVIKLYSDGTTSGAMRYDEIGNDVARIRFFSAAPDVIGVMRTWRLPR